MQTLMSQSKYFIAPVTLCLFTTSCLPVVGLIGAGLLCPMLIQRANILRDFDPDHHTWKHPELSGGRRGKGWGAAVWEPGEDQGQETPPAGRQTSARHPRKQQSSNQRDEMNYLLVGVWGSGKLK